MLATLSNGNQLPDRHERGEVDRLQGMTEGGRIRNFSEREKRDPKGELWWGDSMVKAVGEAEGCCSSVLSGYEQF